jgi:hypothetical protein
MTTINMGLDEVKRRIDNSQFEIISETRLTNKLGTKIVTVQGHVVVAYDSGKAVIQGKNQKQMEIILTRKEK